MKGIAIAAGLLAALAAVTVAAAKSPGVTPTSIARAKLGLSASAYKNLLGAPARKVALNAPEGWSELLFAKRHLGVYFKHGSDRGVLVTTWNRGYKTAAGIGPCSTITRLKKTYGNRLKPSKFNSQNGVVYAYTVGKNLIFASNNLTTVEVVGLYDGNDPDVNKPGGSLSYAGFVTLSETGCS